MDSKWYAANMGIIRRIIAVNNGRFRRNKGLLAGR